MKKYTEPTVGWVGVLRIIAKTKFLCSKFFPSVNMTCDCVYVLHLLHLCSKYCTEWCTNWIDDLLFTFI